MWFRQQKGARQTPSQVPQPGPPASGNLTPNKNKQRARQTRTKPRTKLLTRAYQPMGRTLPGKGEASFGHRGLKIVLVSTNLDSVRARFARRGLRPVTLYQSAWQHMARANSGSVGAGTARATLPNSSLQWSAHRTVIGQRTLLSHRSAVNSCSHSLPAEACSTVKCLR